MIRLSVLDQHLTSRCTTPNTAFLSIVYTVSGSSYWSQVVNILWVYLCMYLNVCISQIWPKYTLHCWTSSDDIPWWSHCQHSQCSTQPNANVPLILLTHSHSSCVEKERERVEESLGQVWHCTPPPCWDLIEETSVRYKVKVLDSLWH